MKTLQAEGLTLEPLEPAHAEEMFALLRDPRLYGHLDHGPPPSVAHLRSVYQQLQSRRSPDGMQHWLNWVIRLPDGRLAGYVQATVVPKDATAWVAYVLGREHWGQGSACAATRCMLDHLATGYSAARFLATVEAENARSVRVLRRLGFVEADAAEAARHDLAASERLYVASPRR